MCPDKDSTGIDTEDGAVVLRVNQFAGFAPNIGRLEIPGFRILDWMIGYCRH